MEITPQQLGTVLKRFFKDKFGINGLLTRYIKTVRGIDRSYYEVSTYRSGEIIPNEIRKKAWALTYGEEELKKHIEKYGEEIGGGNIFKDRVTLIGLQWQKLLADYGVNIQESINERVQIATPQELGVALKRLFKKKFNMDLIKTSYLKTQNNFETDWYEVAIADSKDEIPVELRKKAWEIAFGKDEAEKRIQKYGDDYQFVLTGSINGLSIRKDRVVLKCIDWMDILDDPTLGQETEAGPLIAAIKSAIDQYRKMTGKEFDMSMINEIEQDIQNYAQEVDECDKSEIKRKIDEILKSMKKINESKSKYNKSDLIRYFNDPAIVTSIRKDGEDFWYRIAYISMDQNKKEPCMSGEFGESYPDLKTADDAFLEKHKEQYDILKKHFPGKSVNEVQYIKVGDAEREFPGYEDYPNIFKNGSLLGMKKHGWGLDNKCIVQIGNFYYNLKNHPNMKSAVNESGKGKESMRRLGVLFDIIDSRLDELPGVAKFSGSQIDLMDDAATSDVGDYNFTMDYDVITIHSFLNDREFCTDWPLGGNDWEKLKEFFTGKVDEKDKADPKEPNSKDIMRINDIINKASGDASKEESLTRQMAKSITDHDKAYRRAKAAEAIGRQDLADIFMDKALELNENQAKGKLFAILNDGTTKGDNPFSFGEGEWNVVEYNGEKTLADIIEKAKLNMIAEYNESEWDSYSEDVESISGVWIVTEATMSKMNKIFDKYDLGNDSSVYEGRWEAKEYAASHSLTDKYDIEGIGKANELAEEDHDFFKRQLERVTDTDIKKKILDEIGISADQYGDVDDGYESFVKDDISGIISGITFDQIIKIRKIVKNIAESTNGLPVGSPERKGANYGKSASESLPMFEEFVNEGFLKQDFNGDKIEFWVVTQPYVDSTLSDICFKSNPMHFANQIRGGLKDNNVLGFYLKEEDAISISLAMLQANKDKVEMS